MPVFVHAFCVYVFAPALSWPSLKLECDKLATEKSEMQRHYIMVSESFMNERQIAFKELNTNWGLISHQQS